MGCSQTPCRPSRDLLGREPQEKLEIRLCPDGSGQLYVPGLTEFQVQSVDDINKVPDSGNRGLGRAGWDSGHSTAALEDRATCHQALHVPVQVRRPS